MKVKPIAEFRIMPIPGRKLYFTVRVFATRKAMGEFRDPATQGGIGSRTQAFCRSYKRQYLKNKKWTTSPDIGFIHFYRNRLSSSTVAHECTHAALFWVRRITRKENLELGEGSGAFVSGIEEQICLAAGNLFRDCNIKLHEAGLWK